MNPFAPETAEQAQTWLKEHMQSASSSVQLCGAGSRAWLTPQADSSAPHLSASALRKVHWIDAEDRTCRVEAGISPHELDQILAEKGLCFAHSESWAYPTAQTQRSTLAGLLLGGVPSLSAAQLGLPRDQVLGGTWLLADGTQIQSGARVVKSVAGYDLTRLLLGSRGQLAFCLDLTLRLRPRPQQVIWSEELEADQPSAWLDLHDRAGVLQVIPARTGQARIPFEQAQQRLSDRLGESLRSTRSWAAHANPFAAGTLASEECLRDRVGLQAIHSAPLNASDLADDSRSWPPRPVDPQRLREIQLALVPTGHVFGGAD